MVIMMDFEPTITDFGPILIYFIAQLILFVINYFGYSRLPLLSIFGLIGAIILAIPTIQSMGEYYFIGLLFIIINILLPIMGLNRALRVIK
jgi:hypothetical protein